MLLLSRETVRKILQMILFRNKARIVKSEVMHKTSKMKKFWPQDPAQLIHYPSDSAQPYTGPSKRNYNENSSSLKQWAWHVDLLRAFCVFQTVWNKLANVFEEVLLPLC